MEKFKKAFKEKKIGEAKDNPQVNPDQSNATNEPQMKGVRRKNPKVKRRDSISQAGILNYRFAKGKRPLSN